MYIIIYKRHCQHDVNSPAQFSNQEGLSHAIPHLLNIQDKIDAEFL